MTRQLRGLTLDWGSRTYLMGIINATPDSFSGDGLRIEDDPVPAAVAQARRMVHEGADMLDIGGESTRPGHTGISESEELDRVLPIVRAIREALPEVPLSVDTTKPRVAEASLAAGADLLNDVRGVTDDALTRVAVAAQAQIAIMHWRAVTGDGDVVATVIADLQRAVDWARSLGAARESLIIDPGIGFGKDAAQNLELLRRLGELRALGLPILIGFSRKSTIGRVLDLPVDERLEGTLATTVLAIARGADICRVHDVAANLRAARMTDAIVRGWPATSEPRP